MPQIHLIWAAVLLLGPAERGGLNEHIEKSAAGQRVEVNIAAAPKSPAGIRIPSGALSAALDGSFVDDLAHQIEGEVADHGHIFSAVAGAQA
jgi:hypothetical protein